MQGFGFLQVIDVKSFIEVKVKEGSLGEYHCRVNSEYFWDSVQGLYYCRF